MRCAYTVTSRPIDAVAVLESYSGLSSAPFEIYQQLLSRDEERPGTAHSTFEGMLRKTFLDTVRSGFIGSSGPRYRVGNLKLEMG